MSELTKRILFAVPAAALFLWLTWLGGWYFTTLIIILTFFIQKEMINIGDGAGFKTDEFFPYTFGLWIILSPKLPHPLEIGIGIFLFFLAVQIFKKKDVAVKELISTAFCSVYAPLGMLMLLKLRNTGEPETGFILTAALLLMVWGNDVFAYFGGKYLGKHKLAPEISPNKTWEGFGFGFVGAATGLLLIYYLVPIETPVELYLMLPAAVLVSIFGPVGDLTVSRLKRAANMKDTSHILPGHGGLLDRLDALILAAPALYIFLVLLEELAYAAL
ncbi:MAG: phosphatidate cytidylyltransferase [Balneolaceae bacterium]|nr:phosphatidate cytidylyltransferase [Balneolaceae bacterium]